MLCCRHAATVGLRQPGLEPLETGAPRGLHRVPSGALDGGASAAGSRLSASGGLRFRINSWFDVPQVGGGFETGLQNRVPWDLSYRVRTAPRPATGRETADTLLMLKAMDTQYVVIHGPQSREYYRDFIRPERITAALPAVYHEEDDTHLRIAPHSWRLW